MDDWTHKQPEAVGWYATLICWDPDEGFFLHADYWNGSKWESPVVQCSLKSFDTKREAEVWAYVHDPDGEMLEADARALVEQPALDPPRRILLFPVEGSYDPLKGGTFTVKIP